MVTSLRAWRQRWLRPHVIGYLLLTAGVVAALWTSHQADVNQARARAERLRQLNAINEAQCDSLANLYGVIRKTLKDAETTITGSAYYREHPGEQRDALRRNQDTIDRFKTPPCPRVVTVTTG